MSFLYFIPGANASFSRKDAAALGLAYAFGPSITVRQCLAGPGGIAGVIVADASAEEVGYFPDRQTWRQGAGKAAWHVGFATAARPTPSDLARVDRLSGHLVELLDGNPWLVPVARAWTEEDGELRWYHNIPVVADLDDEGKWTAKKVSERYAAFWDLVCRWDEARGQAAAVNAGSLDAGSVTISFEFSDLLDAAVQVLSQNYRLGRTEAAMLGLLSDSTAAAVMNAAADVPTRLAWFAERDQKKTAPAG